MGNQWFSNELNYKENKMKSKLALVSFLAIASVLILASLVSATGLASNISVEIDDIALTSGVTDVAVEAGETIAVEVRFTADVYASDVRVKVELEGEKMDIEESSALFDVEANKTYKKVLKIQVPNDLDEELSDDLTLTVQIENQDFESEEPYDLRVQRTSYKVDIKSINTPQTVNSGETFPVEIVLKNVGYNDLDDLYVTARIPSLGVERTTYFGDIVAMECDEDGEAVDNYGINITRSCDEDDVDTIMGRLYLEIPDEATAGLYSVEIEVGNEDTVAGDVAQIAVKTAFSGSNVIATTLSKTVGAGEQAEFSLLIVNPTNNLKVFRVVPESSDGVSSSAAETVVAVPAGSSKTVAITASAKEEGEYTFNVNVFDGDALEGAVPFNLNVEGKSVTDPVVVLTIVLAIIFIVLLIVLIVLLGKKPEKSEEFGESYY
jgi:hypothetical protein